MRKDRMLADVTGERSESESEQLCRLDAEWVWSLAWWRACRSPRPCRKQDSGSIMLR